MITSFKKHSIKVKELKAEDIFKTKYYRQLVELSNSVNEISCGES